MSTLGNGLPSGSGCANKQPLVEEPSTTNRAALPTIDSRGAGSSKNVEKHVTAGNEGAGSQQSLDAAKFGESSVENISERKSSMDPPESENDVSPETPEKKERTIMSRRKSRDPSGWVLSPSARGTFYTPAEETIRASASAESCASSATVWRSGSRARRGFDGHNAVDTLKEEEQDTESNTILAVCDEGQIDEFDESLAPAVDAQNSDSEAGSTTSSCLDQNAHNAQQVESDSIPAVKSDAGKVVGSSIPRDEPKDGSESGSVMSPLYECFADIANPDEFSDFRSLTNEQASDAGESLVLVSPASGVRSPTTESLSRAMVPLVPLLGSPPDPPLEGHTSDSSGDSQWQNGAVSPDALKAAEPKSTGVCKTTSESEPPKADGPDDMEDSLRDCTIPVKENPTCSDRWSRTVHALNVPIKKALLAVSHQAAVRPRICIFFVIALSAALLVAGYQTNFYLEDSEEALWLPIGSKPYSHRSWLRNMWKLYDFGNDDDEEEEEEKKERRVGTRPLNMILHAEGENVVGVEGIRHMFEAIDVVRGTSGYYEQCALTGTPGEDATYCIPGYELLCDLLDIPVKGAPPACRIQSPSVFWQHNTSRFENEVTTDEDAVLFLSVGNFPVEVDFKAMFGHPEIDSGHVSSAKSFTIYMRYPGSSEFDDEEMLDRLFGLRERWSSSDEFPFRLEIFYKGSFEDEFLRGIVQDLPLIPVVFGMMSVFTCIVFWKRDWVFSRCLLGFGAVVCVLMSIASGYGVLFLFGVPFTALTQLLPFVIFGIGLDDAFIIFNAYQRTEMHKTAVERVHDTIEEIGPSIFMTTVTSAVAFALGCFSTIPAIRWLCLYSFPTVLIDFVYQITFFIAMLVLDEQRIQNNRRDCLICWKVKNRGDATTEEDDTGSQKHIVERIMAWYANILLRPWVKAFVIVAFLALLGVCAWSASQLRVQFDFTSILPSDSYIRPFNKALAQYTNRPGAMPRVYFRLVDQSDPEIQSQMEAYVNELVGLDQITDQPVDFWLRDFKEYLGENEHVQNFTFKEQIDRFLDQPIYAAKHSGAFTFDKHGTLVRSRTRIYMDRVDLDNSEQCLAALRDQRRVTSEQPINKGKKDWPFFTLDSMYSFWEFLNVTVDELIFSTVMGIVAVSVMALLFIPHWSGALFVCPLITVLYVDILGVLQFAGVTVNGVSYISFVLSIGLMVDYIMHVALRYFESREATREAKTKDVLTTMGASILIGGVSTFLGILPLAWSSNSIFYTIYMTFLGLVCLGIGHGLVLFPVILSTIGPE